MTVTPPPVPAPPPTPVAEKSDDPSSAFAQAQYTGAVTVTAVSWSSCSKSRSDDTPTVMVPLYGRTHAKFAGSPLYWIWSHSVDCALETENAMRCEATSVLCCGGPK